MSEQNSKIAIVCFDEPVFYGRLYTRLIDRMPEKFSLVIMLPGMGEGGPGALWKEIRYALGFFGLTGFVHAVWRTVLAKLTHAGDFRRAAENAGIPVHRARDIHDVSALLHDADIDIVLASVPMRVPEAALRAAAIGWVNTHCGPLPRYAGQNSPFWVLHHGQSETAVTLHYMDVKFDTGPIIAQKPVRTAGHSYFSLAGKLFDEAFGLHQAFLTSGAPLPADARAQDAAERTYFGKPSIADGVAFRRSGKRFI